MMMEFQVHSPEFLTIFRNGMEEVDAGNGEAMENGNEKKRNAKMKRLRQKIDSRSLSDENGNQLPPDMEALPPPLESRSESPSTGRPSDTHAVIRSYRSDEEEGHTTAGHEKTGSSGTGARRNERERNRVRQVNLGFDRLRQHVPQGRKNKKLSKVDTLKAAVDYIKHLQTILTDADSLLGGVVSLCGSGGGGGSGYYSSADQLAAAEAMHLGIDVTSSNAQIDDVFTQLDDLRAAHALFQLGDFEHLLSACSSGPPPATSAAGAISINSNSNSSIGIMPSIAELLMEKVAASPSHSVDSTGAAVSPGAFSSSSGSSSSSSLSSSVYGGAYTNELRDALNTNGHLAFSFSTWSH